jgi:Bacterial PH domain
LRKLLAEVAVTTIEFRAPWNHKVVVMTSATIALAALVVAVAAFVPVGPPLVTVALLVAVIVLFGAAFAGRVRGYTLTEDAVTVRRGLWNTRLPLAGLRSVTGDVAMMHNSICLGIVDGVFSFTGRYWRAKVGWYRALATDPDRAVVLRYPNRTIVITPHDPQHFIMRARTFLKVADFPK